MAYLLGERRLISLCFESVVEFMGRMIFLPVHDAVNDCSTSFELVTHGIEISYQDRISSRFIISSTHMAKHITDIYD
jgi:hypothetical protein